MDRQRQLYRRASRHPSHSLPDRQGTEPSLHSTNSKNQKRAGAVFAGGAGVFVEGEVEEAMAPAAAGEEVRVAVVAGRVVELADLELDEDLSREPPWSYQRNPLPRLVRIAASSELASHCR